MAASVWDFNVRDLDGMRFPTFFLVGGGGGGREVGGEAMLVQATQGIGGGDGVWWGVSICWSKLHTGCEHMLVQATHGLGGDGGEHMLVQATHGFGCVCVCGGGEGSICWSKLHTGWGWVGW